VLTLLRYADELVETAQLEFPSGEKARKAELDMARMLIENLAAEWDPSKYTDEYRDNLMKLIKARIKGKKPSLPSAEPPPEGKVVDLMERLRQSLAQSKGSAARAKSAKRTRGTPAKSAGKKKTRHAA
jgi:DNA end-binding protein Ku